MRVARGGPLLGGGLDRRATLAAVKADACCAWVDDHGPVKDVDDADVGDVDHRDVVEQGRAAPVTAVETVTGIAEAIDDAAVVADLRPPITGVPDIDAIDELPPSRRPQQADSRR